MVDVVTFGCRLNAYESEVIRRNAEAAGLTEAVIFNTCAVTAEAERQARQAIRRARRERPGARLIVTGCAAQISPDRFSAMPEVDAVLGNLEKTAPETFAGDARRVAVSDIMAASETAGHLIDGFEGRIRAFLQIQNGCDHRCTFCIIPYGRGPSRSVTPADVVAQSLRLYENGYRELVLTGVDVGDYGKDLSPPVGLAGLVRRLLDELPDDVRIRITSIDPVEVDEALVQMFADDPRLMPHWHLSVQSGDDMVLRRMARRHRRDDVMRVCAQLRAARPDTVVGADFIAGFPTETEAQFDNTVDLIERAGLSLLHVFPYSEREGTPAARLPQLDKGLRRERAARLRACGDGMLARTLQGFVGRTVGAVREDDGAARTDHFLALDCAAGGTPGVHGRARITGATPTSLIGGFDG